MPEANFQRDLFDFGIRLSSILEPVEYFQKSTNVTNFVRYFRAVEIGSESYVIHANEIDEVVDMVD